MYERAAMEISTQEKPIQKKSIREGRECRVPASFTIEASIIMSVVLLSIGSVICFAYRQKAGVAGAFRERFEKESVSHEDEDYCPEEYMRELTLWNGVKKAYLRSGQGEKEIQE